MSPACVLAAVCALHVLPAAERPDPPVSEPAGPRFEAPAPAAEPLPGAPPSEGRTAPPRARASLTDGFGLDSADGRFGLSLGILGQLRFALDAAEGEVEPGFSLRLARVMIQGHLWGERLTFQVQPEFAGDPRLLDANATVTLHPAFAILAGQYRPWFTRGFPTNLPQQSLPDRGPVLDAFRIDRDVGVTLMGQPFDGRMEYYVGVLDGEGIGRQDPALRNPQPLITARVVGAPLGSPGYSRTQAGTADDDLPFRFAFAANAATNEVSRVGTTTDPVTGQMTTTPLPDRRTVVVGGDVSVQGWRIMAMGEGFWRLRQEEGFRDQAWGTYGQVSGVLVRQRLELSLRAGALRQEDEPSAHAPLEPGLNVYALGDHAKIQLRYRCDLGTDSGTCLSQGGDVQAQLWF